MNHTSAVPVKARPTNAAHRSFARAAVSGAARSAAAALGMLFSLASVLNAQTPATAKPSAWELRFNSGALIPTGNQRSALKSAQLSGVQLSWRVLPVLAVTGQFGWARSRDVSLLATPKLDVFTSDLGVEARPVQWNVGHAMLVTPFAGLGAGVRSYNYRSLDVDATHNAAAYAAVGGEVGLGRVGLRVEARDYATGFKPLVGAGSSAARNDVVITAALKLDLHRAPRR